MRERLVEAIAEMREQEPLDRVDELLEKEKDPVSILSASSEAMGIVGRRFEEGKYFLPELIMAKEILGKTVCIRGDVPLSTMCTGTSDDVKAYCRKLIDVVGRDGGFIMDASTVLDDAKPQNVKAMIEFTKEYGAY